MNIKRSDLKSIIAKLIIKICINNIYSSAFVLKLMGYYIMTTYLFSEEEYSFYIQSGQNKPEYNTRNHTPGQQ